MNFQELEPNFPDPSTREQYICCERWGHSLPDWNRLSCLWVQSFYCSALRDCAEALKQRLHVGVSFLSSFFFFPFTCLVFFCYFFFYLKEQTLFKRANPTFPSQPFLRSDWLGNCLFYDVLFRLPCFSSAWLFNNFFIGWKSGYTQWLSAGTSPL